MKKKIESYGIGYMSGSISLNIFVDDHFDKKFYNLSASEAQLFLGLLHIYVLLYVAQVHAILTGI